MSQLLNFTAFEMEHNMHTARVQARAAQQAALGEPTSRPRRPRFQRQVVSLSQPVEIQRLLDTRFATFPPAA